jgi:hypothetical protein
VLYWTLVKEEQIGLTYTDHLKLISSFGRISNEYSDSSIHVKEYVQTEEQICKNYVSEILELLDYEIVIVCL